MEPTCSNKREPVELLLARIFRRSVRGTLATTALTVACSGGEEGALGSIKTGADHASSARDAETSSQVLDSGSPKADQDARQPVVEPPTRDAGAVIEDSAVTTTPDAARDASSEHTPPPDAIPLTCAQGSPLPLSAAGLKPAATYDYLAVRETHSLFTQNADAGAVNWTRTDFRTLSETGDKCATASGPACESKVAKHPADGIASYCVQICQEWSVVTTRGDEVRRWAGEQDLIALLAPIDSVDEAVLRVAAAGYGFECAPGADGSWVREVSDGFEVLGTRVTSACAPVVTTGYRIHVSRAGTLTVLSQIELERTENLCIGRIPAGLTSQSVDQHRSAFGDHLARAAHLEAASVLAFRRLARELFAHGAPRALVEAALRSATDEVRHAELVGELARAHGGEPVEARVDDVALRTLEELALENATEGCVRETYGALVGAYQAEHAGDGALRTAMMTIARDEARHAALSHRVHAWALTELDESARERVREAQRAAIAELAQACADEPSDALLAAQAGLPPKAVARAFVRELERELWSRALDAVA